MKKTLLDDDISRHVRGCVNEEQHKLMDKTKTAPPYLKQTVEEEEDLG